jgi:hypothetical protein
MANGDPVTVTVLASSLNMGRREGDQPLMAIGHSNVVIQIVRPLTIITVRALRVFLQTLLATLTAAVTGVLPAQDFFHLLISCASISVASAVFCVIQNVIELLAKFDQSHPTLAG